MPGRNPGHSFAAPIISSDILIHENSELFFLGIAPESHPGAANSILDFSGHVSR